VFHPDSDRIPVRLNRSAYRLVKVSTYPTFRRIEDYFYCLKMSVFQTTPGQDNFPTGSSTTQRGTWASDRTDFCKSPISKIDADLLWYIFTMNTFKDEYFLEPHYQVSRDISPLITARRTSQTCVEWRTIMLSSASIWANSLHLSNMKQKNDNWRNEVLRRTGEAKLSIAGIVRDRTRTADILLSLLDIHWPRMRRILLSAYSASSTTMKDPRWQTLNRPAPYLEIFQVRFADPIAGIKTLFSANAPSLDVLITANSPIRIEKSLHGFSRLRRLYFRADPVGPVLFDALSSLRSLEVLDIECLTHSSAPRDLWAGKMPMKLTALRSLNLTVNSIRSVLPFLCHISPIPKCSFICNIAGDDDIELLPQESDHFDRSIANYLRSFDENDLLTEISLEIHKSLLNFPFNFENRIVSEVATIQYLAKISPPLFSLNVRKDSWQHRTQRKIIDVLGGTSSNVLGSVKSLRTELFMGTSKDATVSKCLYAMKSVECLHTSCASLENLMDMEAINNDEPLFPRLHTLVPQSWRGRPDHAILLQFLQRRHMQHIPVLNLDMSNCPSAPPINFDF